jgi:hypothetical protein
MHLFRIIKKKNKNSYYDIKQLEDNANLINYNVVYPEIFQ